MDTKRTIRKVLFTAIWLVVSGGLVTLLVAAIAKKNKELCSDYQVTVNGNQGKHFIESKDILQLLYVSAHGKIKGQLLSGVDMHRMEDLLKKNVWIQDAQLYFDNRDILHVTVTEREPVARIFTTGNKSFYIDNNLKRLPLSDKVSADVPVFTDYPEKISTSKDSALMMDVKNIATFILSNSFWMSQVAQIDMDDDYKFDMIPVVGNHTVELGDGKNIAEKFGRLMVFYKEVLSKTGFDKYASIDVRFAGQVVAVKGKAMTKVDSAQLRKNVEKLMQQAQQMQSDTAFTTNQIIEKPLMTKDSMEEEESKPEIKKENKPDPAPVKLILKKRPGEKPPKAKAVIPEKN
ncbi:MAG: FtsQ-type POTRA domain-containing protein [Bacteroidetes bacterium]|nr:FtsQ-type POTRA domain-containing protein [Bacteroidota bacterium]MBS1929626.1 FtsQ-type POTRA domain-containing protein [Bacteroidota bacterium]